MSIAQAERLKSELTDKYVVVADGVPELRRFVGLTGTVKTVNMSCRALVQFDGPVDISWYDIDPAYLKVIDAPLAKKSETKHEAKAEAPAKPAVEKPAGKSPLDAIRAAGAPKAAAAAPAPAAGAKPSPLDMIRKQVAGGAAPTPAPAPAAGAAKVSPLDAIRKQMAAKSGGAAPAAEATPAPVAPPVAAAAPAPAPVVEAAPVVPAAPAPAAAGRPKSTADILAAIRKQGGNK